MKYSENDFCDLDPTKLCDNCCKCLEREAEYNSVLADFLIEGESPERNVFSEPIFEDDFGAMNVAPLSIDPALLAEWEAKLKDLED